MDAAHFDKDYDLAELLPLDVLEELFGRRGEVPDLHLAVLRPDGSVYYDSGDLPGRMLDAMQSEVARQAPDSGQNKALTNSDIRVRPVSHECETPAYVACGIATGKDDQPVNADWVTGLLVRCLNRIISQNYRYHMTAGLHSQVVQDSHATLLEKNAALQQSEKKYRLLARNLEKEVARKADEIKNAQARLMQQEKMASIGQLAAGVAHEINNPVGFINSNLNTLGGYLQNLTDIIHHLQPMCARATEAPANGSVPSDAVSGFRYLGRQLAEYDVEFILDDIPTLMAECCSGVERIKHIVTDLMDFAKPGEQSPGPVDINRCLESTLNVFGNKLETRATITKDLQPVPKVYGYGQKLGQVFLNLLVNAEQAIDDGCEIRVGTRYQEGWILIEIRDSGEGIPEDVRARIFDPFFTTKPVGSGTGLGLNVAYNIVAQHKGRIEVVSKVGRGTTFTVVLPATSPDGVKVVEQREGSPCLD